MSVYIWILFVVYVNAQYEGEKCTKDGFEGFCTNIRKCKTAIDDIKNHRGTPQICSFTYDDPIVCCLDNVVKTTVQPPVATTSTSRPRTTTEYIPPVYDYVLNDNHPVPADDDCEPLSLNRTAAKTGQKAWDKCIEYQQRLVYPCERGVALTGTMARSNKCKHNALDLVVGGVGATLDEFPHMVLLGYGSSDNIQWLCGGTLLSERFVLTAGHCTFSREFGNVAYARVGLLRRTDPIDNRRLFKIKNIVKHPDYRPPKRYNDIALLEVDRDVLLDESAIPACLDVGSPNSYDRALATGWGATENRGTNADQLQKVVLQQFTTSECGTMFPPSRLMINGFDEKTQICYGDKNLSRDTCQGDSGGPLQIKHKQIICMYTVIGVTSFGRACGYKGEPGMYTRVYNYVPWIESIVWT